jgi:hypothetical protein
MVKPNTVIPFGFSSSGRKGPFATPDVAQFDKLEISDLRIIEILR